MPGPTQLREDVGLLVGLAESDLSVLWREVTDAATAETALRDILPGLIDSYGAAAATVAADWYDATRDKTEVRRSFRAIPADIPDTGAQSLVGWALKEAQTFGSFQSLILGGTERRIANFARLTVTGSTVADPAATGWQRVGAGECGFCDMLIGRGAVYSQATADFASHDNCRCHAAPAFEGAPRPVKPYMPTQRNITANDRARAREYIAANT